MLIKLLIRFLLRKQESYFRIIKVGNRNISIHAEEYIPAKEMIQVFVKCVPEFDYEKIAREVGIQLSKAIEERAIKL